MNIREPHQYDRRILVAVTGLTPQVVTETLYALTIQRQPAFVPTEVHLLTTGEGADRARLMLLDPDEGRFYQLLKEYGLEDAGIAFDSERIHVVPGTDGESLTDICSEADNIAVADFITEVVRELTGDPGCAVHASIAGGRKTMGFYLGYAMSLYGRSQDRLSHVLVNAPFESDHQFYYPPARPHRMIIRDQPVHTSDARVMLAEIPFVRMREGLPERLREGRSSFRETVEAAQKALQPPSLLVDLKQGVVEAGGERLKLPDAQLAFYAWLARRRSAELEPVRWTDGDLVPEYLECYRQRCGAHSARTERQEVLLGDGFTKEWFEQTLSKVNGSLKQALGEVVAGPYLIHSMGQRPNTRYGLSLPPEAVEVRG